MCNSLQRDSDTGKKNHQCLLKNLSQLTENKIFQSLRANAKTVL